MRGPSLVCALMGFVCVLMAVTASLLGGEKHESESLPYVPVSTFPPFSLFKIPRDPETSR